MKFLLPSLALAVAGGFASLACAAPLPTLDDCNVVWDSPSKDVSGTMPLGNGDIGANVWVQDGDLLFLIGKTDAWDENSINCKLARVRVKLSSNPFAAGNPFRQELRLRQGEIVIQGGTPGAEITMRLWVDANQPVIRVETTSEQPVSQEVLLETWRDNERVLQNTQVSDMFKNLTGADPYPTIVFPDVVVPAKDQLLWYHHNRQPANDPYVINLTLQGMQDYQKQIPHPLLGRTFGASIQGPGFVGTDSRTLVSAKPAKEHRFSVFPLTTLHPVTVDQWRESLEKGIRKIESTSLAKARKRHAAWWENFWDRSWIQVAATSPESPSANQASAFELSRAYALCRFMNAAGGRGAQPIKYNGSIFTVGTPDDPDFRRWGGPGFWFQNQRLVYWPMLAAGDYDLMEPWFRMYRESLPFAKLRSRLHFNHDGAFYGETILFWGAEASGHYGWTPFEKRATPHCESPYLTYYWQNNIENIAMMLDYFEHTGDTAFARRTLMPHADEVTKFYDLHYKRDENGRIRFDPAAALETWHKAVNPLPEIAGLMHTLPRLIALPKRLTTAEQRERWQRLLAELPPLPTGTKGDKKVLLPAETFSNERNVENPELYGVFPYRLFGVGKPDHELARDTFAQRKHRQKECWSQNDTQAALLGLTAEAKDILTTRASAHSHRASRFPAFWDAFNDWIPDIDHGGNLQLALQYMVMQAEPSPKGKIHLLPTWPKEWDVSFKLHAPGNTVVECIYRGGKIEKLKVTPSSRRADLVLPAAN